MHWFLNPIQHHYADLTGRARRKEFWMFLLIAMLISFGLALLDRMFGTTFGEGKHERGVLEVLFNLLIFLPSLAVGVRRLHDLGRSGWWWLLFLVPIANLGLVIYMCFDGQPGPNQYGPNPKEAPAIVV